MTDDSSYVGKSAYKGQVAVNYERDRVHEPVWLQEQAWMERWAKGISPGACVLDVPTGTGRFVGIFRGRGAEVHAVDVSEDMLAELRRRWPADDPLLTVLRAEAEALPFARDKFDFVVCWRLFHLLPVAVAARVLSELARVCRGRIVLEVFGVHAGGLLTVTAGRMRARVRSWLRLGRRSTAGQGPWAHITNYPHAERELQALFLLCGLRVVASDTLHEYAGTPARIYILERGESAR